MADKTGLEGAKGSETEIRFFLFVKFDSLDIFSRQNGDSLDNSFFQDKTTQGSMWRLLSISG